MKSTDWKGPEGTTTVLNRYTEPLSFSYGNYS